MAIEYDNLTIANGVFEEDTKIETVTVPDGGLKRGSLLGKITATSKYVLSLGTATDGSENPKRLLYEDVKNDTGSDVDNDLLTYNAGTFGDLGVVYGTGQTMQNTYDSLDAVNIRILEGRM